MKPILLFQICRDRADPTQLYQTALQTLSMPHRRVDEPVLEYFRPYLVYYCPDPYCAAPVQNAHFQINPHIKMYAALQYNFFYGHHHDTLCAKGLQFIDFAPEVFLDNDVMFSPPADIRQEHDRCALRASQEFRYVWTLSSLYVKNAIFCFRRAQYRLNTLH